MTGNQIDRECECQCQSASQARLDVVPYAAYGGASIGAKLLAERMNSKHCSCPKNASQQPAKARSLRSKRVLRLHSQKIGL